MNNQEGIDIGKVGKWKILFSAGTISANSLTLPKIRGLKISATYNNELVGLETYGYAGWLGTGWLLLEETRTSIRLTCGYIDIEHRELIRLVEEHMNKHFPKPAEW